VSVGPVLITHKVQIEYGMSMCSPWWWWFGRGVGGHHQRPCSHLIRYDLATQELSVEVCMYGFHTSSTVPASPASSSHRGWIARERLKKRKCFNMVLVIDESS